MKKLKNIAQLRCVQDLCVEGNFSKGLDRNIATILKGLELFQQTGDHYATAPEYLQKKLGLSKTLDLLYLVGIYGLMTRDGIVARSQPEQINASDDLTNEDMDQTFWSLIGNQCEAVGYVGDDRKMMLDAIQLYVGSPDHRRRLQMLTSAELEKEIFCLLTSTCYLTKMEYIFGKVFGKCAQIDGGEKKEAGYILGYQYSPAFMAKIQQCSAEIGDIVQAAGAKYVPYGINNIHTTVGVVRQRPEEQSRKNNQGLALLVDDMPNVPPVFMTGEVAASKDTVVMKMVPSDSVHLHIAQQYARSTPMVPARGTHITIGRFVGVANALIADRIQAVISDYTLAIQDEFSKVSPEAIFTGTFNLDTYNEAGPIFTLIKTKLYTFGQ